MINEATALLRGGKDLNAAEMEGAMRQIMGATATVEEMVAFLQAYNAKKPTVEELAAAARIMRSFALPLALELPSDAVILDTCGTGGDKKGTFNVSTVAAFVVSGCGVTVAKHGNRAVSSSCGSADILEALGIRVQMPVEKIAACLKELKIAFLFAQQFHPAVKHVMPARKQIAAKTLFNILGPLCNPAKATHQLTGVYDPALIGTVASVLGALGTKHALVVHGADGLDEITLTDATMVAEWKDNGVKTYTVKPEDFGFRRMPLDEFFGGSVGENVQIMLEVLNGKQSPRRTIVVANAAAALYAADKTASIAGGIALAEEAIDSGRALKKLALFKEYSRST
jgi:anthranilate phosphoribosyltransferase